MFPVSPVRRDDRKSHRYIELAIVYFSLMERIGLAALMAPSPQASVNVF